MLVQQSSFFSDNILFGSRILFEQFQHRKSYILAWQFLFAKNSSTLRMLKRPGPSQILLLTKRSSASGDENKNVSCRVHAAIVALLRHM